MPGTSTTTAQTIAPATATNPVTTAPAAVPSYLVYGWEGVTRIEDDRSTHLVTEPVSRAVADGAGGIVVRSVAEQPGWAWLSAGAERPVSIDAADGARLTGLYFPIDGRPSALVSRFNDMTRCVSEDYIEELSIRDLETGDEQFLMCHDAGQDGGEYFTSLGGGLFTSVAWAAVGAGGTDTSLSFYDLDGERVPVAHNPFAESCAPCRLSVKLSPDGALLAYARWPTAYWEQPEPSDGDYTRAYRDWYAQQQHIPTEVVIIEIATGVEVFRTDAAADAAVAEFDGRFVAVGTDTGRRLFDIESGDQFEVPPAMTAPVAFWTVVLASLDNKAEDYNAAQRVAGDLAAQLDGETGVLWSDGFITLNPGFWAIFTGHFPARHEALNHCDSLETRCYPRYVASADTADLALLEGMLGLESDGLGLIQFGQPEGDVRVLMERIVGSAPTDPGDAADWVEYVGWEDLGLYLGFSRPMWEGYDGVDRFVGWQYRGETDELALDTEHGVRIGTSTAELRAVYGDALVVPTEPDVCADLSVQLLGNDAGIVAFLDEAGVVRLLVAGLGVGC